MMVSKFVRIFNISSRQLSAKAGSSGGHGHATGESLKMWKNLTYFVAIPAVLVCMVNAGLAEKEHLAHFHRPEFVPYEHMRVRTKPFPWGDGNHSLMHNKKVNALPDGYEE